MLNLFTNFILLFLSTAAIRLSTNQTYGQINPYIELNVCDEKCGRKGYGVPKNKEKHVVCECHIETEKFCLTLDDKSTSQFRLEMLTLHNQIRVNVANGSMLSRRYPPAAGLTVVNYNLALEYSALCSAYRCSLDFVDTCIHMNEFPFVTQNTASFPYDPKKTFVDYAREAVRIWFPGTPLESEQLIERYKTGPWEYGMRIISQDTHNIGCASTLNNNTQEVFIFCNYQSSGSTFTHDSSVYQVGPFCTNCPRGTKCNDEFYALCGKIYPVPIANNSRMSSDIFYDYSASGLNGSPLFSGHVQININFHLIAIGIFLGICCF